MARKRIQKAKYPVAEKIKIDHSALSLNAAEYDLEGKIQEGMEGSNRFEAPKKDNIFTALRKWMGEGPDMKVDTEITGQNSAIEILEIEPEMKKLEGATHKIEEKNMDARTTVIAENVEIIGDVKIEGNLEFYGKISGNIDSKGDINMSNSALVEGKIRAVNLGITNGSINGNLNVGSDANLGVQSRVVGDIQAQTLTSSGTIIGNVYISDKVVLNETSIIEGNIKAKELEVKVGAVIKGQIEMEAK